MANPDNAAELIPSAFDALAASGHALAQFFDALPRPDSPYAEICQLLFGPRPSSSRDAARAPPGYVPPPWR